MKLLPAWSQRGRFDVNPFEYVIKVTPSIGTYLYGFGDTMDHGEKNKQPIKLCSVTRYCGGVNISITFTHQQNPYTRT